MFVARFCLLLVSVVFLMGCNNNTSGVSEAEAKMTSEEYDAMIEAEELNRDGQPEGGA
jgi:hypothetical protein